MTSRGRPRVPGVPGLRRRPAGPGALLAAAALTGSVLTLTATPARADDDPDVAVRISSVSPTQLREGRTVVLTGTVTNRDGHAWRDAQAYLVMSRVPYQSREMLTDAIVAGQGYTGTRVVEPLTAIDELGDLDPGEDQSFEVRVPYAALGLSGADGVYPVGIQVLGTDSDGSRSSDAIGRATTFLTRAGDAPAAPTGLVWPFLATDRLGADSRWVDPARLASSVASGPLRHRLDLAASAPPDTSTVLLDPALLTALDDQLAGRRLPRGYGLDDAQREAVEAFRTDLVALARDTSLWTTGYDRPDVLALSRSGRSRDALIRAVDTASLRPLVAADLSGRRVDWPATDGMTSGALDVVRRSRASAAIVGSGSLPQWQSDDGSVVRQPVASTQLPVVVRDPLDVPGSTTMATVRQQVLADATFASLSRQRSDSSAADALTVVDPDWDPGAIGTDTPLDEVFDADQVRAATPESLLAGRLRTLSGRLPARSDTRSVDAAQVTAVADSLRTLGLLTDAVPDSTRLEQRWALEVAATLGVRWRSERVDGLRRADSLVRRADAQVQQLTIEGPPAFTLSGERGSFPLTLSNGTRSPVEVDVRIDSTNPALQVDSVRGIEVAPGARRTVNVAIDVGNQSSTTLTAHLTTTNGRDIGQATTFNIRSSRVGTAVWIALGVAGMFVLVTIGRRIVRRARGRGVRDGEAAEDEDAPPATA